MEVLILWYIVYGKTGYEGTVHLAQLSWQMGDSDLTLCSLHSSAFLLMKLAPLSMWI